MKKFMLLIFLCSVPGFGGQNLPKDLNDYLNSKYREVKEKVEISQNLFLNAKTTVEKTSFEKSVCYFSGELNAVIEIMDFIDESNSKSKLNH